MPAIIDRIPVVLFVASVTALEMSIARHRCAVSPLKLFNRIAGQVVEFVLNLGANPGCQRMFPVVQFLRQHSPRGFSTELLASFRVPTRK